MARSCLPSPLKSPTATSNELVPVTKLVGPLKLPAPLPNKIDTLLEPLLATARSCLPSPLKSPTASKPVELPGVKIVGPAKVTDVQMAGVVTVNVKLLVALAPVLSNALTVTVYVPAGCAFVTRTTPVVG